MEKGKEPIKIHKKRGGVREGVNYYRKYTAGKTIIGILNATETEAWQQVGGNGELLRYALRCALKLCLHENLCDGVCSDCSEKIPESFLLSEAKIQNFLTTKKL